MVAAGGGYGGLPGPAGRSVWTPWNTRAPEAAGKVVVYCFAHAGGAANSYLDWARQTAGQEVEVCPVELPGHGTRMREAQLTDVEELLGLLVTGPFSGWPGRQAFVLFGHSMGALIAYALAQRLGQTGAPLPLGLIVSAARPPGSPEPSRRMAGMSDSELLRELADLEGTPAEVLGNADMTDFVIGRLRADLALLESAERVPPGVLDCPIDAFGGVDDDIAGPGSMQGWSALTSREFRSRTFAGGHFYLHRFRTALLSQVRACALRYLAAPEVRQ